MARYLWACWDGGGNLPPSLGIARELAARGDTVTFAGRPDMLNRVHAAGFDTIVLTQAYAHLDRYSSYRAPRVVAYISSAAVGEELASVVLAHQSDIVVVDAMFSAALVEASRFVVPTAVVVHTFLHRVFDAWLASFAHQSEARGRAGFDRLPDLEVLWGGRDLVHVNTLAELNSPAAVDWGNIRHGAPVLENETRAVPTALPWGVDDSTPLVLVSFSTVVGQESPGTLQRVLDALAPLPVHVVVTTGGVIAPSDLARPDNAHIVSFADHGPIMERASLVVTHGGHGTTMRALAHGVPILCIPAVALDQAPIGMTLQEWEVGRLLSGDASADALRDAVTDLLGHSEYRRHARRRAKSLAQKDGASLAVAEFQALISAPAHAGRQLHGTPTPPSSE